jgi:CBS-domain-containing membrane protein
MRVFPSEPEAPGAELACVIETPPLREVSEPSFREIARESVVGAAMGPSVVCVRAEVCVSDLRETFRTARSALLPVVDALGRLVGVVWRDDSRVDSRALALDESASALEALRAMTIERARAVPVVGEGGAVVGVLSDIDLLGWLARERRRWHAAR